MSARATSFYYSFLALPADKRNAIIAVWDFCRAVDDAVDEPGERDPAYALGQWREEVTRLYDGREPATPQGRQLQPYISKFNLPRTAFEDLIDGVAMDLQRTRYATFEELRQYCLRVASAVGLICVEIFGYRNLQTRDYAIDLGIALQLTNIIRDLAPDLERGRLYIPTQDLRRFGCTEADLRAGIVTDNVRRLLSYQVERARQFYGKADAAVVRPDERRLVAARIMGAIYYDLLRAIERADYDVFRQNVRVSRPRQAFLAGVTWLKVMMPSNEIARRRCHRWRCGGPSCRG
jgi:phytoene synthase